MKKSSGVLTESGPVMLHAGKYYGFSAKLGTGEGQVKLWDNPAAASGKLVEDMLMVSSTTIKTDGHDHNEAVECNDGLYLTISGVASAIVYYFDYPAPY
jgi:hypothetical protein